MLPPAVCAQAAGSRPSRRARASPSVFLILAPLVRGLRSALDEERSRTFCLFFRKNRATNDLRYSPYKLLMAKGRKRDWTEQIRKHGSGMVDHRSPSPGKDKRRAVP